MNSHIYVIEITFQIITVSFNFKFLHFFLIQVSHYFLSGSNNLNPCVWDDACHSQLIKNCNMFFIS